MKKLTYFIDKGNGDYEPFYEYTVPAVGIDELYARQLCTYFIMRGRSTSSFLMKWTAMKTYLFFRK